MKRLSDIRESKEPIAEALRPEYVTKIKQLIKLGLISSDKGQLLIRALGKGDVTELSIGEKEVIVRAFETLLNHVVDDRQTFQRLKTTMKEDVSLDESEDVSKEHGYEPGSYRDLVHAKLNTKGYKRVHDDEYVHPTTRKRLSLVVRDNKVWKTMSTSVHEEVDEYQKFAFPSIIILRRKAIRLFPDGKKVGLYYADKLKRYFSIPSTGEAMSEANITEAVSNPFPASPTGEHSTPVMSALKGICANKEPAQVQFRNGSKLKVDILTAHAILTVYGRLSNPENQVRFDKMLNRDNEGFMKIVSFVHKHYTSGGQ
jgi:hypothetical protein